MIGRVSSAQFDQESESMERDLAVVFSAVEEEVAEAVDQAERERWDAETLLSRIGEILADEETEEEEAV